jgi:two-component system nitrogen regulation response regulator GlnG
MPPDAADAADTSDDQVTRTTDPRGTGESPCLRVPGLVILSHPEPDRVGEEAALIKLVSGEAVKLSRREPLFAARGPEAQFRPLDDTFLSRTPLTLRPGSEPGSLLLDRAGSPTQITAGGEEVGRSRAFTTAEISRGVVLVLGRRIALLLHPVDPGPVAVPAFGLVGESAATVRLRQEIRAAAGLDVPVLLRGETGTGKELVARALHDAGRRRRGPYVAVNMAALPPSLAAAELFGAARGAYTGADRKKIGFFQSAQGGTLFLDEVGDMPSEVQALLLRALENREIQPVGSVETLPIDVRIVAATDAALEAEIAEGRFRAPLLHRLAGFEIRLPALRERRDDVARLFFHFLREEAQTLVETREEPGLVDRPWPPAELVARLVEHDWPGNVRQLRNVTRRLLIARRDGMGEKELGRLADQLLAEPVPSQPAAAAAASAPAAPVTPGEPFSRRFRKAGEVSAEELLAALEAHRWQLKTAARALGVSRGTLYRLVASSQVRKAADLAPAEIAAALDRCGGEAGAAARDLKVSPQGLKRRITALRRRG